MVDLCESDCSPGFQFGIGLITSSDRGRADGTGSGHSFLPLVVVHEDLVDVVLVVHDQVFISLFLRLVIGMGGTIIVDGVRWFEVRRWGWQSELGENFCYCLLVDGGSPANLVIVFLLCVQFYVKIIPFRILKRS